LIGLEEPDEGEILINGPDRIARGHGPLPGWRWCSNPRVVEFVDPWARSGVISDEDRFEVAGEIERIVAEKLEVVD